LHGDPDEAVDKECPLTPIVILTFNPGKTLLLCLESINEANIIKV